jgi:predicted ATPase/class 3 adenylate cyclase
MMKHNLTPRFILQQYAAGKQNGRLPATALFVDISGFTAVTEALMQQGKVGAELLADTMQAIFTPLIAAVYERGGFVAGFAGDAFTAVFPGRGKRAKARAVAAAWAMRLALKSFSTVETPMGIFSFTGRIGVAAGSVNWGILGNSHQRTAYFRGRTIDLCAKAEHQADDGEVVLAVNVADALSDQLRVSALADSSFVRLDAVTDHLLQGNPPLFDEMVQLETAAAFHAETLLNMAVKGEFRQVVTVFINLGSTPRPNALAAFMQDCFALLGQYGGTLCRLDFGDKGCNLLLFWGAPTSYENDIERALNFLLNLKAAATLPLRAGVTVRQAFAGFAGSPLREEYTCYGLSINQSARQMMAAPWGQLWLDKETAQRAELFEVTTVGSFSFKGFTEQQSVFQLVGRREVVEPFFRGLFAGRQAELSQLEAVQQSLRNGRFAPITLFSGEAGIGKSRLVYEFLRVQQDDAWETQQFVCQTDEILRRPLNPFRYWLRRYFKQSTTQDEAANKDTFFLQLTRLIAATAEPPLQAELERTHVFLGALVDLFWSDSLYDQLEPSLRFENTISALKTVLRAESLRKPLFFVIEDGQWLDEESRLFLRQLPRNMEPYPVAVLITSRESIVSDLFDTETAVIQLPLSGLREQMIVDLAQDLLGAVPQPELAVLLQERAEGNPFFLEQIVLYLQEQGMITKTAVGVGVTAKAQLLPEDVQAVLVARLDRLTQTVRNVVQTAAVLGREFEVQVLSHMLKDEGSILEWVEEAEKAAVWSVLSELTYLFRHALLRDAAYQMQLQRRLEVLHRLAAEAITRLFAADLSNHYVDLTYHYRMAGDMENERLFALQAGEQAAQQYANEEALTFIERVIELTPVNEINGRFNLLKQREKLLSALGARERQADNLQQMAKVAEQIVDEQKRIEWQATVSLLKARLDDVIGNYEQAINHAQTAVSLAESLNNTYQLTDALVAWSITLWHQGSYEEAHPLLLKASELARIGQYRELDADSSNTLGLILMYQSQYNDAITYFNRALVGYRALGNRRGEALAINSLGVLARETGDQPQMRARFEEALQIFREIGLRWGESGMLNNLGLIQYDQGAYEQAYSYFEDALINCREIGNWQMVAQTLSNLGLSSYHLGNFDIAVQHFTDSLKIAENLGDRQVKSMVLENWATLMLEVGNFVHARTLAAQSLQITQEIGKRYSESHAMTLLGSALVGLGLYDDAHKQFAAAIMISQELDVAHLSVEAFIGRIRLLLEEGDLSTAWSDAQEVLNYLKTHGVSSIDDSFQAYAACLDVLSVTGNGDIMTVAHTAHTYLQTCAAHIVDDAQRTRFLIHVSSHKRILDYYQQLHY